MPAVIEMPLYSSSKSMIKRASCVLALWFFSFNTIAAGTSEWRLVFDASQGRIYIDTKSVKRMKGVTRARYLVKFRETRSFSDHGAQVKARSSVTDFEVKCGAHEMRTRWTKFYSDVDAKGPAVYGVQRPDYGESPDIAWFEPVKDGSNEDVIYDAVCEAERARDSASVPS